MSHAPVTDRITARGNRRRGPVRRARRAARGFTLLELMIAGMVASIVVGASTLALMQAGRARTTTRQRLDAYARASAAIEALRRESAAVLRRSDLFETRLLLVDESEQTRIGELERDELLLFNMSLRPTRPNEYSGEGAEYEAQFRIAENANGLHLWQRRDAVPDEYPDGGGIAIPLIEGIIELRIEAYDGENWFDEWDSDLDGLPWALRFTVTATGAGPEADPYEDSRALATLRTQVAIDRIIPPPPPPPEEDKDPAAAGTGEDGGDAGAAAGGAGGGALDIGGGRGGGALGGRGGEAGGDGGGARPGRGSRTTRTTGGGGRGGGPGGGTGNQRPDQ